MNGQRKAMGTPRYDKMELIETHLHVSKIRIILTFLVYWFFFPELFYSFKPYCAFKIWKQKVK